MQFNGTEQYLVSSELQLAVEAAIRLQKPLLIKGEPGTGKTQLAYELAKALGKQLISWNIKSSTTAQQGLYEYDAVSRLRDSQLGSERVQDLENYIQRGKIWEAFEAAESPILLIDEIDKADIEFPNDLLQELDKMEFYCYELQKTVVAKQRPIVIITSNNEKELPDAFLRRCFFHYIAFPEADTLEQILLLHFPELDKQLLQQAILTFSGIRENPGLKKKPATSELIDWIRLLLLARVEPEALKGNEPPYLGALLKHEQDFESLSQPAYRSYY